MTLSRVQLDSCIDSLRRAGVAADSARQLCEKAASVFAKEAKCVRACQTVLESYLNPQTVLLPRVPPWSRSEDEHS